MAKNLALLALLLGIAALFLPLSQTPDGALTKGVLMGTETAPIGAMFMGPQTFAALFGATLGRKRFARGLGALHLIFGLAGTALVAMIFSREGSGQLVPGMGTYSALASGVLVTLAGLIGLIKPDPKLR
jgi:multisubunit Na+/H+ antiporter MnhB subunit